MSIGGPHPWYPWAILHHFPLFSSERVPERSLMGFVFGVGVIAAFGADFIVRRLGIYGAALTSVLVLAIMVDAWLVNRPNLNTPAETAPPQIWGESLKGSRLSELPTSVTYTSQFRQFWGSPWEMVGTSESNMGSLFCNEGMTDFYDFTRRSVVGFNQAGYFGEQYLVRPGALTLTRWTPNALSFDVDSRTDNVLVVNQVYDSNWKVVDGQGEVVSEGGLIGVRIPAGTQHLKIAYRSNAFRLGIIVTLMTVVVAVIVWRREGLPIHHRESI
ncbi:MAG TPA: YfhO family protein, partial [Candidatus Binataceae bacterium]|nr:YfhO family protein [Candidatus Binataceae bacterium]